MAVFLALAACKQKATQAAGPSKRQPVPVTVATVTTRTIPVELRAIGNVEAYSTIGVKSMVAGQITHAYFTEGDMVHKGQRLFEIDPRPFEEAVKQAEANLEKDEATAANAKADADRYEALLKAGVVARQDSDLKQATYKALYASLAADRAAVSNAKLQVEYCKITSPLDGRTGNVLVKEGNVVKANDVSMVNINQIHPIYVTFAIPERDFQSIQKRLADHLAVLAYNNGDEAHQMHGKLTFADNMVDQATGTIRLKATFENTDNRLWPGQFVNVMLTVGTQQNAILVPSQAVQTGQNGQFVFVVKPDMTVEMRTVVVGHAVGNEQALLSGVKLGETVVTDGQSRLVPGAEIEIAKPPANGGSGG
ncbi:MAG TPA: efflux RND transporter periplasmic adaptor subunit [Bryobacteraceae bacterium]|nr:efflux RND transporter periplasmic adaptor subunit [Bryobacteraceae bacterium]